MKLNKWQWMLAVWGACLFLSWLTDGGPLALGVIVIPIVAFAMWASERKQKEVAKEAKNAEDFGTGFKYSHLAGPSGIAIDPDRKMLRLRAGADTRQPTTKDYPFSEVREFEKVVLSGGQILGSHSAGPNMASALGAAGANASIAAQNRKIKRQNELGSGIFVTVKDIDHPKWRVAFANEKDMDRWMEILRQCLAD